MRDPLQPSKPGASASTMATGRTRIGGQRCRSVLPTDDCLHNKRKARLRCNTWLLYRRRLAYIDGLAMRLASRQHLARMRDRERPEGPAGVGPLTFALGAVLVAVTVVLETLIRHAGRRCCCEFVTAALAPQMGMREFENSVGELASRGLINLRLDPR